MITIAACSRKPDRWQRMLPRRHHGDRLFPVSFAHEMAIALLGQPARPRQVGVVDVPRAFRLAVRVEAEQDRDRLPPARAVRSRVVQAEVALHVLAVVGCQFRAIRRCIEKGVVGHGRVRSWLVPWDCAPARRQCASPAWQNDKGRFASEGNSGISILCGAVVSAEQASSPHPDRCSET